MNALRGGLAAGKSARIRQDHLYVAVGTASGWRPIDDRAEVKFSALSKIRKESD